MNKDDILKATKRVTNKWAKMRKAEERRSSRSFSRRDYMYSDRITIKSVADKVMKQAYMKASGNGKWPANARQIMYAARPEILAQTGLDKLKSKYFTQHLLPDYIEEHPAETAAWDVVFDARGHFTEPHTETEINLGGVGVRNYLTKIRNHKIEPIRIDGGDSYPTKGPKNRYGAVLFVEKEGFNDLLESAKIAKRYDICIMSTKGMSTTAARELVDELCVNDITLFVLHDFDKSGFSIASTLQKNTRRYSFRNDVNVIDIGVRLEDIEKYNLQSEPVSYGVSDPVPNLMENGATEAEAQFLCSDGSYPYSGQRVEINALNSPEIIELIETKLKQHGVKKVIPDKETLQIAFRRAALAEKLNKQIQKSMDDTVAEVDKIKITPAQIEHRVRKILKESPAKSWDDAILDIVGENGEDD